MLLKHKLKEARLLSSPISHFVPLLSFMFQLGYIHGTNTFFIIQINNHLMTPDHTSWFRIVVIISFIFK